LGSTGLEVSPVCLGICGKPQIVPQAFDVGVNFFFLTADLHWPLYDGLRRGLSMLLSRGGGIRDQIVVAAVSYLEQPLFGYLQVNEVVDAVPGLERVDVLLAGAVPDAASFNARFPFLQAARSTGRYGSRAIGASFHDRQTALACLNLNCLDLEFIRYNAGHPGARREIFPYVRRDRLARVYNFTSTMSFVTREHLSQQGMTLPWIPKITDYYRFALSNGCVDGLLCAPREMHHIPELTAALDEGPLTPDEQEYMVQLATAATPRYF
jgi:hypothetical protein